MDSLPQHPNHANRATGDADATSAPLAPIDPAELAADPRKLGAVLAAVLDQQSRDAAANRAQARELVRAVEGLAKSHEFLGMELREERRRSRLLVAALVLVPLAVVAVGGYLAWSASGTDDRVADLDRRIGEVASRDDAARVAALRTDYEARLAATSSDSASIRADLDTARTALSDERRARESHEKAVAARLAAAEADRAQLAGLRAEMTSVKDLAGAERARADEMARLLAEAVRTGRAAGARGEVSAPSGTAAAPPAPGADAPSASPLPPASSAPPEQPSSTRLPEPQPRGLRTPPPAPPGGPSAARDPADLERIRTRLNALLEGTTGVARYRLDALSGVSGTDLLGVRMVGTDTAGRALRTVEADHAEITVSAEGSVRFRFTDGHLLIGGRKAPFFDGAYVLTLGGSAEPWRTSGLTCVRLP